jgi:hypothetical protein
VPACTAIPVMLALTNPALLIVPAVPVTIMACGTGTVAIVPAAVMVSELPPVKLQGEAVPPESVP